MLREKNLSYPSYEGQTKAITKTTSLLMIFDSLSSGWKEWSVPEKTHTYRKVQTHQSLATSRWALSGERTCLMSLNVPSNLYTIVNCNCSINVFLEKNHFGNQGHHLLPPANHAIFSMTDAPAVWRDSSLILRFPGITYVWFPPLVTCLWQKEYPIIITLFSLTLSYYC